MGFNLFRCSFHEKKVTGFDTCNNWTEVPRENKTSSQKHGDEDCVVCFRPSTECICWPNNGNS